MRDSSCSMNQTQARIPLLLSNEKSLLFWPTWNQKWNYSFTPDFLPMCSKWGLFGKYALFSRTGVFISKAFPSLSRRVSREVGYSSLNLLHGSVKALRVSSVTLQCQMEKDLYPVVGREFDAWDKARRPSSVRQQSVRGVGVLIGLCYF